MKTPTSYAPHIWWTLRRHTSPIWPPLSRPIAISSTSTMIQVVRIAVPAMYGAKLKATVTLGLAAVQVAASAEQPTAWALNQLTLGSVDQGPVQAATTASSTANGSQACSTSPGFKPCDCVCRAVAASTGTPP